MRTNRCFAAHKILKGPHMHALVYPVLTINGTNFFDSSYKFQNQYTKVVNRYHLFSTHLVNLLYTHCKIPVRAPKAFIVLNNLYCYTFHTPVGNRPPRYITQEVGPTYLYRNPSSNFEAHSFPLLGVQPSGRAAWFTSSMYFS